MDDTMSMGSSKHFAKKPSLAYALNDFDDAYSVSETQSNHQRVWSGADANLPTKDIMELMSPKQQLGALVETTQSTKGQFTDAQNEITPTFIGKDKEGEQHVDSVE